MVINKFGEMVFSSQDLFDSVMQGQDILQWKNLVIDSTVDSETIARLLHLESDSDIQTWRLPANDSTVEHFDKRCQQNWYMPKRYHDLDIAQHVLDLCTTDQELQRCGQELLLYQERSLFDLLKYLVYLVEVMRQHKIIWGVGRGSSVSSYVLYKLGVHRVDSLYYDLDPGEFFH